MQLKHRNEIQLNIPFQIAPDADSKILLIGGDAEADVDPDTLVIQGYQVPMNTI